MDGIALDRASPAPAGRRPSVPMTPEQLLEESQFAHLLEDASSWLESGWKTLPTALFGSSAGGDEVLKQVASSPAKALQSQPVETTNNH